MAANIRKWRQVRQYRTTAQQLRALPAKELSALGITPTQIDRLARQAAGLYS